MTDPRGEPRFTATPGATLTSTLRVRYAETDQMGVVYHAHYLVWCEIGRTDLIRALGLSYAAIEEAGTALAVAEASLRFHASAKYDDAIDIVTAVVSVRSRAVVFRYVISNAQTGDRLCTVHTTLVSLDRDGRPVSLPPDVRARLASVASEAE